MAFRVSSPRTSLWSPFSWISFLGPLYDCNNRSECLKEIIVSSLEYMKSEGTVSFKSSSGNFIVLMSKLAWESTCSNNLLLSFDNF
jgi:hypothetical protein